MGLFVRDANNNGIRIQAMNEDLVKFHLPTDFVTARAWPWPSELAYGWKAGWIDSPTLVAIAERELIAGLALPPELERLALLLRDEYVEIPDLAHSLADADHADASRLWLYLALAWLFSHRAQVDDPLGVVEMLYADFGYPNEIEGLVRYMPVRTGESAGTDAIRARWNSYLESQATQYGHRGWPHGEGTGAGIGDS